MQFLLNEKRSTPFVRGKWRAVKLSDVCDFINGFTFKSETYSDDGMFKIITIANVQDGFMNLDSVNLVKTLPLNITKQQILKRDDVLISMTGNVGRVCKVIDNNCLLNQRVGKIIPKKIDHELLYYILSDRSFLKKMIDRAQGGAQGNLSASDIKNHVVNIPESKEDQTAIAEILTAADKEIKALEKKRGLVMEQKKFLLNNLITGKIRLPEFRESN
jgi:type I restriction enzyme S subunit